MSSRAVRPAAERSLTHTLAHAQRALLAYWVDPLATRIGRLTSFFLLYVSEGVPLGFTAIVIATHMRREGLDPAVIGAYVGSLYLPWAFKWAFGPIVDTITSVKFGRRRTWIVGAQIAMMLTLLAATPIDFASAIGTFTAIIFVHNICAATQDVAIDALAVQVLPSDERGTANGFMFAGQAVGQAFGGGAILLLGAALPFAATYLIAVALIGLVLVTVSWRLREDIPATALWSAAARSTAPWLRIVGELREFVSAAGRAFTGTRAAALGVVFAALPLGAYALALALQSNLAVELGLHDRQIGTLNLQTSLTSAIGCVVGGWLSDRYGRRRMIALFVVLTAIPPLCLAVAMQHVGHIMPLGSAAGISSDPALVRTFWTLCVAYSFVQGLTYGSSTALFMDITTPAVAATQFTAYMALGNLATSYTSTWQGFAAVHYGYPITLGLDALVGMLCLTLLPWLGPNRPLVAARATP